MTAIAMCCGLLVASSTTALSKNLTVDIRVCTGDPLGSRADGNVRYLAEVVANTPSGKPVELKAGGEVPIIMYGKKTHYIFLGTAVEVVALAQANGKAFTDVNLAYSPHESGNVNGALNGGFGMRATRMTKLGETFKIRISKNAPDDQLWVEVTIRAAGASSR